MLCQNIWEHIEETQKHTRILNTNGTHGSSETYNGKSQIPIFLNLKALFDLLLFELILKFKDSIALTTITKTEARWNHIWPVSISRTQTTHGRFSPPSLPLNFFQRWTEYSFTEKWINESPRWTLYNTISFILMTEVEFVTHVTHGGSVKFLPAV